MVTSPPKKQMAKFPYGPGNWHIISSNGPSTNALNFYSTCYSTVHGKETARFDKVLRHRGTGYDANFRPTVYYSKQVDALDNPAMSQLLKKNYSTETKEFFTPHTVPTGYEHLPAKVHSGLSGYSTSSLHATPTGEESRLPSSENRSSYSLKPFIREIRPSAHAALEGSGFTHASTTSVIPNKGFSTERDGSARQYIKQRIPEALPAVYPSADCSNGFVKGQSHDSRVQPRASEKIGYSSMHPIALCRIQKQDPAEYSSIVAPDQYLSLTRFSQECARSACPSEPQILHRIDVGRNAPTGFVENNVPSVGIRGTGRTELLTTYRATHGAGTTRDVRSCGRVRPALPDGFTKSTRINHFGPHLDTGAVLRNQDAYVARSIMKRDPCFDDHTYDRKLHS